MGSEPSIYFSKRLVDGANPRINYLYLSVRGEPNATLTSVAGATVARVSVLRTDSTVGQCDTPGVSEWPEDKVNRHFAGMRYGDFKQQVAEMVVSHLEPFQQRYREITTDPGYLAKILEDGAAGTVRTARERMGLCVG